MEKPEAVQQLKKDLKVLKTNLAFAQRKITVIRAASVHLAHGIQELARPSNGESRNLK